jgi:hypothetical protein
MMCQIHILTKYSLGNIKIWFIQRLHKSVTMLPNFTYKHPQTLTNISYKVPNTHADIIQPGKYPKNASEHILLHDQEWTRTAPGRYKHS